MRCFVVSSHCHSCRSMHHSRPLSGKIVQRRMSERLPRRGRRGIESQRPGRARESALTGGPSWASAGTNRQGAWVKTPSPVPRKTLQRIRLSRGTIARDLLALISSPPDKRALRLNPLRIHAIQSNRRSKPMHRWQPLTFAAAGLPASSNAIGYWAPPVSAIRPGRSRFAPPTATARANAAASVPCWRSGLTGWTRWKGAARAGPDHRAHSAVRGAARGQGGRSLSLVRRASLARRGG